MNLTIRNNKINSQNIKIIILHTDYEVHHVSGYYVNYEDIDDDRYFLIKFKKTIEFDFRPIADWGFRLCISMSGLFTSQKNLNGRTWITVMDNPVTTAIFRPSCNYSPSSTPNRLDSTDDGTNVTSCAYDGSGRVKTYDLYSSAHWQIRYIESAIINPGSRRVLPVQ